jgi:2-dehydro-3-deoxygalactonokinase
MFRTKMFMAALLLYSDRAKGWDCRMVTAEFIGGDWGTTHLRLFLCGPELKALEQVAGPGVSRICGEFEKALDSLIRPWVERHGELPILLSGMVGSSIGWVETPYLPCPVRPEQLAAACIQLRGGRIRIVPGLSCRNRLDVPDFMRGEETQLLGALQLEPALSEGSHLVCLPGTHTKWSILQDGSVQEFLTAPTGEIYASLCSQTTLVPADVSAKGKVAMDGFNRGLERIRVSPDTPLLQSIFTSRSLRLSGELAPEQAASYLSGLLIGSDASGALQVLAPDIDHPRVHIIGSSQLCRLYSIALATLDAQVKCLDGSAAAVAGLAYIDRQLHP